MNAVYRLFALAIIFCAASFGWVVLGGTMIARTDTQERGLEGEVAELWGRPMAQTAPIVEMTWVEEVETKQTEMVNNVPVVSTITVKETRQRAEVVQSSNLTTSLSLDERRKGLVWFPLYDVDFHGDWSWTHRGSETGVAWVVFSLPDPNGVYDAFQLKVNGQETTGKLEYGVVRVPVNVVPGDEVSFSVGYRSRGLESWSYLPVNGVGEVTDFALTLQTDFAAIDFPAGTLSPSSKTRTSDGWTLTWAFDRLIAGKGMGMVMPERIQPGELASSMSFSAPISLGLFMIWVFALGLLKKVEVHPMNHLMVAAAFFSFHLLFAYTADHLPVEAAFALSAATSVILVVSYLRLAVGPRFALLEAGGAQLVYLIGFSLAHFWEGFTGLTVTVLCILTLFALMQLTGRIRWAEVFAQSQPAGVNPS